MAQESEKTVSIRRILVAVDTSTHSRAAMEAAVIFAKITEANVHGLFVHEEHWSHISRLPSTRAISELTGSVQVLEEDALESQVQILIQRLHRKLKAISRRYEIGHSWSSVRGRVIDEILKEGTNADLIIIGRRGSSFLRRKKLGSTAEAIIRKSDKPILVLADGLHLQQTITVVYDGSKESRNGLLLAFSLAEKNRSKLFILIIGDSNDTENNRDEVEKMVNEAGAAAQISTLKRADPGNIIYTINRQRPGLLIIPKKQRLLKNDMLEVTLEYILCPVLMV